MTITPTSQTHPSTASTKALRGVLIVLGAVSAFVAINVAFGGLETLGLQGPTKYFQVTDHDAYLLRDSHAHFYGGVYLGIAIFLIVASTNLHKYRTTLDVVFALIFLGGVARLTQLEPGVTFGNDLAVSTLIELVGMPAMTLWLAAATKSPRTADATTQALASHA
jgi:VanZ family protein